MIRKILVFAVVIIGIMSFNAYATINATWVDNEIEYFALDWNWHAEGTPSSWTGSNSYWSAYLQVSDTGSDYKLDYRFRHTVNPHGEDTTAAEFSGFANFGYSDYGLVVNESGTWPHPSGTHYETWAITYDRNPDSSLSSGTFAATHMPEPISSTLFLIGGATLGFRRFKKKFKK